MTNFSNLLDAYIAALGLSSDYGLAKRMGISAPYVHKMRHQGKATDEFCLEMARVLKVEPGLVLLARNALKDSGEVGEAWKRLMSRVAGVVIAISVSSAVAIPNGGKGENFLENQGLATNKDYRKYLIMLIFQLLTNAFKVSLPVIRVTASKTLNAL